ncbi:MAG: ribonuclease P protein component [Clostridiales bacterium]|nr:ribonuclease P protein component [Clostridiales bacterium]
MKDTVSLKLNHEFRRLYSRGKSAVSPCVAVYCRRNKLGKNRLGLTVGTKVGKAVIRNRTRRRIREAYRLHEGQFQVGYDIVVVARVRASFARYREIERQLLKTMDKLGLVRRETV